MKFVINHQKMRFFWHMEPCVTNQNCHWNSLKRTTTPCASSCLSIQLGAMPWQWQDPGSQESGFSMFHLQVLLITHHRIISKQKLVWIVRHIIFECWLFCGGSAPSQFLNMKISQPSLLSNSHFQTNLITPSVPAWFGRSSSFVFRPGEAA